MKPFCERLEDLIVEREVAVMKADVDMVKTWIEWAREDAATDLEWSKDTKKAVLGVLGCLRDDILDAIRSRKEDRCCSQTT